MNTRFEIIVEVNGQKRYLDTYDYTPISFNYSINEVQDISTTNGGYSKNISLPATKNNRESLGFIQDISVNTSINPNKKIKCWILTDTIVTIDGYLQIKKINYNDNQKSYSIDVIVFSDNFNFFKEMGEKYLTDIDISELNHKWNNSNIVYSWTQSYTNGYYYPLIDYGSNWNLQILNPQVYFGFSTLGGLVTSDLYPSIYVKYLFDKMIYENGYTYTSNFLNSDRFKNLLIPFSLDAMYQDPRFIVDKIFRAGLTQSSYLLFGTPSGPFVPTITIRNKFPLNDESSPNGDPNGFWNTTLYEYTNNDVDPFNQRFGFRFDIDLNRYPDFYTSSLISGLDPNNFNTRIVFYRSQDINGVTSSAWLSGTGEPMPTYNGQSSFNIINNTNMPIIVSTVSTITGVCNNIKGQFYTDLLNGIPSGNVSNRPIRFGESVRVVLERTFTPLPGSPPLTSSSILTTINPDTFLFSEIDQTLIPGQTLDMNRTLPINIKQKDFFQSIVKMFNLYVETDKKNKNNLFIEPRDEFYATGKIKDWSDKIDFDSIQSYDILANTQDKTYLFKYKDDKDYFNQDYIGKTNESYGQFKWEIDSDFKTAEKKMEVIFSPTPLVLVSGSAKLVIPKIYKLDNNQAKKTTSNIRIVTKTTNGLVDLSTGTGSYTDTWNLNGVTYSRYPYVGHFDTPFDPSYDLNFGSLRGLYYSNPDVNIGNTASTYLSSSLITNNNLVNDYWANFLSETMDKDSRIVYVNALLDPQDIYDFRFNDNIFIDLDGGGQYFKVNAIKDYNPGMRSLCKLELLKTKSLNVKSKKSILSNNGSSRPNAVTIRNLGNAALSPGVIHNGLGNVSSGLGNFINGVDNVTAGQIISINGFNNISGQGSENMFISGNNNNVKALAKRGTILGSNNTIEESVSDVVIIGNNINATENDTIYLSGKLVTAFNLVDAGTDIVLNPFQEISISNLIDASTDVVQQLGSNNTINLIDAGTDSVL